MDPRIATLLDAWFGPPPDGPEAADRLVSRWFVPDAKNDREIERRFGDLAACAARGELDVWRGTARGRLALILLLDQIPRQLNRGTAAAFAQDAKALELALTGIERRLDLELEPLERAFFYMPLQHAEAPAIQDLAVRKYEELAAEPSMPPHLAQALAKFADYARAHRNIVERFGRFPHRNAALGRETTADEAAYLAEGAPTFGQ
ncbi:MAG TPA: DUF924 family protein [Gammaproteobacteria bacterium]|nr:DUF924 family protein [Gammaproteobacteria bacterium]